MEIPLQVTYRGVEQAELVTKYVRERAEALETFAPQLISCRVIIEAPHRHHREGRLFHVRIDMTVPGAEVVVGRDPAMKHAHEDVFVAIRDAFDAARRRVEDHSRRRRGAVKQHERPSVARVANLYPEADYGFLEAADGRRIYFHRHAVLEDGFDQLEIGAPVTFFEEDGEKGPQARTVQMQHRRSRIGAEG